MDVIKKIKYKDLVNCSGKIICFWSRDSKGIYGGYPHYFEWVKKVKEKGNEKMILISCYNFDKKNWNNAYWLRIKGFNFRNNDWYVFNKKDFDKVRLVCSLSFG